jgi:hypothetical protein
MPEPDVRLLVTRESRVTCDHALGVVALIASQGWVRVDAVEVLVQPDPERRTITGCPNIGATVKPCTSTLAVETGYSGLVRVDGRPVVRSDLAGFTDGTPPGAVRYGVADPLNRFVRADV